MIRFVIQLLSAHYSDQVWKVVQQWFPDAPFSHDAVYNYWCALKMKDWKFDPDPVVSATKILEKANMDGGWEGQPHRVCIVDMGSNSDYECLAFSIPDVLELWKD